MEEDQPRDMDRPSAIYVVTLVALSYWSARPCTFPRCDLYSFPVQFSFTLLKKSETFHNGSPPPSAFFLLLPSPSFSFLLFLFLPPFPHFLLQRLSAHQWGTKFQMKRPSNWFWDSLILVDSTTCFILV